MKAKRIVLVAVVGGVLGFAFSLLDRRYGAKHADAGAPMSWSYEKTTTTSTLRAIRFAADAFAVGDGGLILHLTGGTWRAQSTGTHANLRGIGGLADVYAVGEQGTILRFVRESNEWTAESSGTTEDLDGVAVVGTKAFAVGARGALLVRDQGAWAPVSITDEDLHAVIGGLNCSSANETVFVVGAKGLIFVLRNYYMPTSRWEVQQSGTTETLRAVTCDEGEVVAVGTHGVIVHSPIRSLAWTVEHTSDRADLFAVAGSSSKLLAGGASGAFVVWRNGRSDRFDAPDGVDLYGMAPALDGAFVVGARGSILRFDFE